MSQPGTPASAAVASASAPQRTGAVLSGVLLAVFGLVSVARLVAIPTDLPSLSRYSTFFLMTSLAAWVLARRGPLLIVAGLIFSWVGDLLLGQSDLFIAGMGAFAVAHICYVTHFLRTGAASALRRRWWVAVVYLAATAGLAGWLWDGLGDLRIPVLVYALLLAGTATTSGVLGAWLGVGGALFFISDSMIAAFQLADKPEPPMPDMWIMATYIVAQFLLASGAIARAMTKPVP